MEYKNDRGGISKMQLCLCGIRCGAAAGLQSQFRGMGSPKPSSGHSVNPAFKPILWFNISKVET